MTDGKKELSLEEQAEVFRIARNFQDKPKKVIRLIKECVGEDGVHAALEFLKSIGTNED